MSSKIRVLKAVEAPQNLEDLRWPLLVSPKLDGIRAVKLGGQMLTQNGLPIANDFVRKWCELYLPEGADGELLMSDDRAPFKEVLSAVRSKAGDPDFRFAMFDIMPHASQSAFFAGRLVECRLKLAQTQRSSFFRRAYVVPHQEVTNADQLRQAVETHARAGYEGTMARWAMGQYKQGRSTLRECYLVKIKAFADEEAVVTGFYEEMENVSTELTPSGNKTSGADSKVGKGRLGGFECRFEDGTEFRCGSGLDAEERVQFWADRESLVGKTITVKYQPPPGGRPRGEGPRFPVFKGFREDL